MTMSSSSRTGTGTGTRSTTHRTTAAPGMELELVRPLRIATHSDDRAITVDNVDVECIDTLDCDVDVDVDDNSMDEDSQDSTGTPISDDGVCDEIEIPCDAPPTPAATLANNRARKLLYISLFCYHLSEMTWVFGSALWLAALGSYYSSLFWISAYQATAGVLIIALVPILSSKIDGHKSNYQSNDKDINNDINRSRLVSIWIIGQHVCVMVTIVLLFGTLGLQRTIHEGTTSEKSDVFQQQQDHHQQILVRIGLVLICLFGGLAQVLHQALQVAIERDWIVVMAEEADAALAAEVEATATDAITITITTTSTPSNTADASSSSSQWLQDTNVAIRQIYLLCQALGPLLTGVLVDNLDGNQSLWIVLGLKAVSMVVVCACMHRLCEWVPALKHKPKSNPTPNPTPNESKCESKSEKDNYENDNASGLFINDNNNDSSLSLSPNDSYRSRRSESAWQWCCSCSDLKIYGSQKGLVGAGIALALLYSNVLTFGGMMVAYMAEKGNRSAASIGLWKGLSDVAGFLGTVWFSRSKKDLETKGLLSLSVLLGCLTLSMAGVWIGVGGGIGAALVILGVIPSRIGLWAYDLSVMQLYQNRVAPSLRGTVGGTQTILNNVAEFVPFVLGMVVSRVDDFWIVMVVGYFGVAAALLSYAKGTYYDYYYYFDYDHCSPDDRPTRASSSNLNVQ